jgi:hypothetical protein
MINRLVPVRFCQPAIHFHVPKRIYRQEQARWRVGLCPVDLIAEKTINRDRRNIRMNGKRAIGWPSRDWRTNPGCTRNRDCTAFPVCRLLLTSRPSGVSWRSPFQGGAMFSAFRNRYALPLLSLLLVAGGMLLLPRLILQLTGLEPFWPLAQLCMLVAVLPIAIPQLRQSGRARLYLQAGQRKPGCRLRALRLARGRSTGRLVYPFSGVSARSGHL